LIDGMGDGSTDVGSGQIAWWSLWVEALMLYLR
jgi:hypothetical protein